MKKLSDLILSLILSLSSLGLVACSSSTPKHTDHTFADWTCTTTHHYKVCTIDGCEEKQFNGAHAFTNGVCVVCDFVEVFETEATPDNFTSVISKAKDGLEITLAPGRYSVSVEIAGKKNLTLTGTQGVIFEDHIRIASNCENLTIQNITFNMPLPQNYSSESISGGIRFLDGVNGLTIRNCEFTNFSQIMAQNPSSFSSSVKDLVIDGCNFIDIANTINTLTAIYMGCVIENVTVNNCSFIGVEYNALQLSGTVKGNVTFTNSTYRYIGNRYFNINNAANVNWNISGNKFYSASTSATGKYFKGSTAYGTTFVIGVNYWEQIPDLDTYYFALYNPTIEDYETDGITYNYEEQLGING